jgi:hypothetical protein
LRAAKHILSIVLPEGLVKQSACLLAVSLAPLQLGACAFHVDDDLLPAKGCINIMNDTVCKLLLVAKAERKKGGAQALTRHLYNIFLTKSTPLQTQ